MNRADIAKALQSSVLQGAPAGFDGHRSHSESRDTSFLYYPIFLTPAHPTNLQIVPEQSVSKLIGNIWMVDRNLCKE
jgi:hypothetical protein